MIEQAPKVSHPGKISWRLLTEADQGSLLQLIARIEESDNPPYRTTDGEVSAWLSPTTVWEGICGIAEDGPRGGQAVAFGQVSVFRTTGGECLVKAGVDPEYRSLGLEEHLVDWQVQRGTALYADNFPEEPGSLVANIDSSHTIFEDYLKQKGYLRVRTTHELRRALKDLPRNPDIGSYREIVPWTPALDEQAWRLYNRIVERDRHGHHPREEWLELRESFVADWSFVALSHTGDRPKVEGFILVSAYQRDWEVLGWKEGYIDLLGVTGAWIRDDLSQALVIATMRAQKNAGMDQVAAGVGTASRSQVTDFFEDLGFAKSFETRTYSLQI